MPFGQLIIGSPGAGKTTYCAGAQSFLDALGRPAQVVNLDPANLTAALPYAPVVDINSLITVTDVMRELELGPNGALLYCIEYLEANVDWLLDELDKLGKEAYCIFDLPGQVELSTNHPSLRRIVQGLEKRGWRLVAVHLTDATHITDASRYVSLLLLSLRAMLALELPHINVLSKVDLLGEAMGAPRGSSEGEEAEEEEERGFGSEEDDEGSEEAEAGTGPEGMAFNLSYYTRAQDLSYLTHSLRAGSGPLTSAKYARLNERMCELVEDFSIVGFETLAVEDKRSMLRLTRVIDKAGGFVYAPPTAGAGAVQGDVGKAPKDVRDVHLPRVGDPELAAYEPGSLAATTRALPRAGAATAAALFGTADGDIHGWGEAADVQERWVDHRAAWDAWELQQAKKEHDEDVERGIWDVANRTMREEQSAKEESERKAKEMEVGK